MRIYCDGIFDLFHKGHLTHFKKIHALCEPYVVKDTPIVLIVGLISDSVACSYKRKPIFNETQRLAILNSCKYVDEVFITNTLVLDAEFMKHHTIDYVVHAFNDGDDKSKQNEFFQVPIKMNKFIEIPYNVGISTTQIINESNLSSEDLSIVWSTNELQIEEKTKVLEIGCTSDVALHENYIGIDTSLERVIQHRKKFNNNTLQFESIYDIFKNKYFDTTIINSDCDKTLLTEAERITKKSIYIKNLNKYIYIK
jgi:cytidyltransferase-like protein